MASAHRTRRCLAACAASAVASLWAASSAAAQTTVVTFPQPGAGSASPHSEISFRGATAEELRGVTVTGSRSGRHRGELRDHSDGRGVSFLPARRFAAGERVRVQVPPDLRIHGAFGRVAEFTVARVVGGFATRGPSGAPSGHGRFPALRSRPDLAPPTVRPLVARPGRTPGYVFLAPKLGPGQGGPMIVDDSGRPVWFRPMPPGIRANDVRVQTYRGQPVITWWEGRARGGSGRGVGVILDQSYNVIKRVRAGNGLSADLHEFRLTDRGTALLLAYVPVRRDLSEVGGPRAGIVVDGVAQEIEIETGRVRWEWHSLDHVPLRDSNRPLPSSRNEPWDYFHPNSLNLDADGSYIISARSTSAVYSIGKTGEVRWVLGGRSSTFRHGPGTRFALQHDAIGHGDGVYTLFDNSARGVRRASRGIAVRLDEQARTATLLRTIRHPQSVLAATQANMQLLPGGHVFVGWGSQGRISEFDADGNLLLDLKLPVGFDTYRAYRFAWEGVPDRRPALAAAVGRSGRTTVYMSWNGSTELHGWRVLAGDSPRSLQAVDWGDRKGLETQVTLQRRFRYVAAEAVDARGRTLARSATVRVPGRG